jgi:hypothetical protein
MGASFARDARNQVNTPAAAASGRATNVPRQIATVRKGPVTTESLYLSDVRPPAWPMEEIKAHHVCDICWSLKSHPVSWVAAPLVRMLLIFYFGFRYSYRCGHSHCYVCIHVWLEKSRKCPHCMTRMREEPYVHLGERQGIEADYPGWVDKSVVNFSFAGVLFT